MRLLSHRGAGTGVPENTLEAFALALEAGLDGIETDVRACAGGELVLFHDQRTRCGRAVGELDLEALRRHSGIPVPRLEEALDAWPQIEWNLELKRPELAGPLSSALAGRGGGRLMVSSFFHQAVCTPDWPPGVARAVLVRHRGIDEAKWLARLGQSGLCQAVVWNLEYADRTGIGRAHRAGLKNLAYQVDSRDDLDRAAELGLDGLIVDRPREAVAWRNP